MKSSSPQLILSMMVGVGAEVLTEPLLTHGTFTVKFSLPLHKPQILNPQLNLLTLRI